MTIHIDPGGEKWRGFACNKLRILKEELTAQNRTVASKWFNVEDATIFINTLRVFDNWLDTIKITAGGPWDFLVTDIENSVGNGGGFYGHFSIVGRPGFRKIKLADLSPGTVWRAVRIGAKARALVRDATETNGVVVGWKLVNDHAAVIAFSPATLGDESNIPSGTGNAIDANETKLFALLNTTANPDTGKWLSDGTDYATISPPVFPSQQFVLANANDGFAVSQSDGPAGIGVTTKVISLANGALINASMGVHADDVMAAPLANYTDLFQFHLFTPDAGLDPNRGIAFYRNGMLDYTTSETLGGNGDAQICTRSGVHAFMTLGGLFQVSSGAVGPVDIVAIRGNRVVPPPPAVPSYSYTEVKVLLDTDYDDSLTNELAVAIPGFTDTSAYLFVLYRRNGVGIVSAIIDSAGSKVFSEVGYPTTVLGGVSAFGTVNFFGRTCLVGSVDTGTGFKRTIFFLFSDSTHFEAVLPDASVNVMPAFICGSKTTAYAYIRDTDTLRYLVDSTGTVTVLPIPTRPHPTDSTQPDQTAITTEAAGFIDREVGCRLLFESFWATAPTRSYHHWDETGTIFNYGSPSFAFSPQSGPTFHMVVPEPSTIHRMKLLELWNSP